MPRCMLNFYSNIVYYMFIDEQQIKYNFVSKLDHLFPINDCTFVVKRCGWLQCNTLTGSNLVIFII